MTDYCAAGDIIDIGGIDGEWRRLPDAVRYDYTTARTTCPICKKNDGGVPWAGWFSCGRSGCCVALVNTGEVFVRLNPEESAIP